MLDSSCHCQSVKLKLNKKVDCLTECNCSVCSRYGALWAYGKNNEVVIQDEHGRLSFYMRNEGRLKFYFCKNCGMLTHYEDNQSEQVALNARLFQSFDLTSVRIRKFDGANTWSYID